MKIFKTRRSDVSIEEKEAERANPKTIFFGPYREARFSNYHNYFDTREEAVAFLKNRTEQAIANLEKHLARAKEELTTLNQ